MRPLVLTSTVQRAGGEEGPAPRVDYLELARALGADLSHPVAGRLRRAENAALRLDVSQALRARRRGASLYFSLSEGVGIPLEAIRARRTPHALVAHNLTTARRRGFERRTHLLRRVDRVVVLARAQERYLLEDAGLPRERVRFLLDKVDHRFFAPQGAAPEGYVVAVGREQRDYATLVEAMRGVDARLVLVPSSAWFGGERLERLSENVEVRGGLSFGELRELYDRAALVVVPLQTGVEYAAGANGVLEAMAMRKPLVVTATPGIADYVADGETARTVPPGEPAALREAIVQLLGDAEASERLAAAARRRVEEGVNLDAYVERLASVARELS